MVYQQCVVLVLGLSPWGTARKHASRFSRVSSGVDSGDRAVVGWSLKVTILLLRTQRRKVYVQGRVSGGGGRDGRFG